MVANQEEQTSWMANIIIGEHSAQHCLFRLIPRCSIGEVLHRYGFTGHVLHTAWPVTHGNSLQKRGNSLCILNKQLHNFNTQNTKLEEDHHSLHS